MAIFLRTGVGGAGKTINTIDEIFKLVEDAPNREVYTFNITFIPDHPLYKKVENWHQLSASDLTEDLPKLLVKKMEGSSTYENEHPTIKHGSIILVDEAQDLYPTRSGSQKMPDYLKFFERHRHAGLDFFIVTQKPRQIDIHLRELVNHHKIYTRAFGLETVKVTEANNTIEAGQENNEANLITRKPYPKNLYGLYQSSVLHTHKKKLPKKVVYGIPFGIALVFALFFLLFSQFDSMVNKSQPLDNESSQSEPDEQVLEVKKAIVHNEHLFDFVTRLNFLYEIEVNGKVQAIFIYQADGFKSYFDLAALQTIGLPVVRVDQNIYLSPYGFIFNQAIENQSQTNEREKR